VAEQDRGNKRASNISPTKAKAQAKGRDMAKERHTEHKIQNQKGQITERNSYGRDPYPAEGLRIEKSGGGAVEAEAGYQKGRSGPEGSF
jgi:Uncharacterized protein conserved in bacteria (DUF2188)